MEILDQFGQISTKFRYEKSFNGFSLDVLKSALQKYIRRCMPEKAIYAGAELDLFSLANYKDGERIRTNFIHRLMIIYMEDIFNPGLWCWMNEMIFKLLKLREKRKEEKVLNPTFCDIRKKEMNITSRIIYALCTSSHSRENSYYKFCYRTYFNLTLPIRKKMESRFPFLEEIKERSEMEYKPSKPFTLFEKTDKKLHHLSNQFLGALEKRNPISIFFAYQIVETKKLPEKFYRSQKPEFLIFFLLDYLTKIESFKKYKELPSIGVDWFKELNPIDEDFLPWQNIILIFLKDKPLFYYKEEERYLEEVYRQNIDGEIKKFDDYVYDMHTSIGRRLGKGSKHFGLESSKVCNELQDINQDYKDAYTYFKIITDSNEKNENEDEKKKEVVEDLKEDNDVKQEKEELEELEELEEWLLPSPPSGKESDFSNFLLRAQLVTGNAKTDTYFAEKDGKVIFVKGPLYDKNHITEFMKLQEIKKNLGLNTLDYKVVYLKPDLFADKKKNPLGKRHSLSEKDKNKEWPFIVSDVLFDYSYDKIPHMSKDSKLWPDTKVVNWEKVKEDRQFTHLTPDIFKEMLKKENEDVMKEYVKNIIFRYIFGVGDLAGRNFIIKNGEIFSVDEDVFDKDFDLSTNLGKNYDIIISFMKKNKEYFRNVLVYYLKYAPYKDKGYKHLEMSKEGSKRMGELYEIVKNG